MSSIDRFSRITGERIRYLREQKGYSLQQFGEMIGVHKANLNKIEKGQNLTLVTLLKISAQLDVSISKLLDVPVNISKLDVMTLIRKRKAVRKKPIRRKKRAA